MEKQTIYGLTRDQLIDWAIENGEKKFRATRMGLALPKTCSNV